MAGRFVTVWCPDWPIVAAGLVPDEPAIVIRANRVIARSAAAAAEGVVAGQRRRQAQQCCPDATLVDHDPARDARAFEPLVQAAGRFTPRVELIEPGWSCLDARGPSRYFGGDQRLAERLVAAIGEVTPAIVGVGVADGRFASAIAARRSSDGPGRCPVVVAPDRSPAFVAPLPVAWLQQLGEVDAELVGLFARLGLARLGDLAALPAVDVAARFGPPGRHAHRLAGGADDRPPAGSEPPPRRAVERVFDDPVAELGPLVFTGKQLADELVAGLSADGCVCTRLVIVAETEQAARSERVWYRAGGMSAPAMVERLRWQLDGWLGTFANDARDIDEGDVVASVRGEDPSRHAGRSSAVGGRIDEGDRAASVRGEDPSRHVGRSSASAVGGRIKHSRVENDGVVLLRLAPEEVRRDDGDQLGLWGGRSAADERATRAVTRLTGLVGDDAVLVPAWRGGRLPGERYEWVPASSTDLADPDDTAERLRPQLAGPWPGTLPAPSPMVVPAAVVPAELVDAAGQPVGVGGRGELSAPPVSLTIDGGPARPVRAWAGPWPLDERWWDPGRRRRLARFQVVTDDGAAHLVLAEHRRWWVAASYG